MVNNSRYHCRESLEINSVPTSTGNDVLESSVCKVLSLTGHAVKPDDLQARHRLKKRALIVKFKCRKQERTERTCNKLDVLTHLNFSGRLFVLENICRENHQLSYKCRQLKKCWQDFFHVVLK